MQFDVFSSIFNATDTMTLSGYLICIAVSLVLGVIIALCNTYKNNYTKSFTFTLAILPVIVQTVIVLVNGELGTAIAIAGAFSLVRFRSVPASGRDITFVFLAMTIGLANGVGFIGISVILTIIICLVMFLLTSMNFGSAGPLVRDLKIVIPEGLNYEDVFEAVFKKYTSRVELLKIKTTNMGSLFNLHYSITLKRGIKEKEFIDELRIYNGNLEVSCAKPETLKSDI